MKSYEVGSPASEPRALKRMMPRGCLSGSSWALIKLEQNQLGFGWSPVFRGLASHVFVVAAVVGVGWSVEHFAWSLTVLLALLASAVTGIIYRGLECLVHGAAHDDVYPRHRGLNDVIGNVLFGWATAQGIAAFRANHVPLHHAAFGGAADPCRSRMVRFRATQLGRLPALRDALARTPAETWSFYTDVGTSPARMLLAAAWQLLAVLLPAAAMLGIRPALEAYLFVIPVGLGVFVHLIRALAEAGEHDYRHSQEDSIIGRTFDNIGPLNCLLHLHGDGWHALHHLAPGLPQSRLRSTMRRVLQNDAAFAQYVQRRTGVLHTPRPYLEGPTSFVADLPLIRAAKPSTDTASEEQGCYNG